VRRIRNERDLLLEGHGVKSKIVMFNLKYKRESKKIMGRKGGGAHMGGLDQITNDHFTFR